MYSCELRGVGLDVEDQSDVFFICNTWILPLEVVGGIFGIQCSGFVILFKVYCPPLVSCFLSVLFPFSALLLTRYLDSFSSLIFPQLTLAVC